MICPHCQANIPDNSNFCTVCGVSLVSSGAENQQQPMPPNNQMPPNCDMNIPDYLVWSILELVCCCLPFGIVSLIYSVQANNAKKMGNFTVAHENAEKAKKFLIWGVVLGAVVNIAVIAIQVLAALAQTQVLQDM